MKRTCHLVKHMTEDHSKKSCRRLRDSPDYRGIMTRAAVGTRRLGVPAGVGARTGSAVGERSTASYSNHGQRVQRIYGMGSINRTSSMTGERRCETCRLQMVKRGRPRYFFFSKESMHE